MTSPKIVPAGAAAARRTAAETRQLILQAATRRFAGQSYEETSLRQIAADVGVDVALVHRSFGSKERLFVAVHESTSKAGDMLAAEPGTLATSLAQRMVQPVAEEEGSSLLGLFVLARSFSSPQAGPLLRDFIQRDFTAPLAARFDAEGFSRDAMQRATLLTACLCGVAIFRHVLGMEALSEDGAETCEPLITALLDTLTGEAIADPPPNA
ncbi:TetR family transcriptional regulator [Zavarzinia sp.]|uniref:TetR/AcrR family transcriptional regulator n=1 Tax=Zavarzinia sp. TaxID=2027920 RepID=UPI0035625D5A